MRTAIAGLVNNKWQAIEINPVGSDSAFSCVSNPDCDIGISSKIITSEKLNSLVQSNAIKLSLQNNSQDPNNKYEYELGFDGVVFIVNRRNPVTSLTVSELSDIFLGKITNWSEIQDDINGPINVYIRTPEKSGTYNFVQDIIAPDKNLKGTVINDSLMLSSMVSDDIYSIGFVGSAFSGNTKKLEIGDNDNTIYYYPDERNIRSEKYRFSRSLYFYISNNTANEKTNDFINFATSENKKIQDILINNGFYPRFERLNNRQEDAIRQKANSLLNNLHNPRLTEYIKAIKDKELFQRNIQFSKGACQPNVHASEILDKLRKDIKPNQEITIIAFTDDTGIIEDNDRLAKCRHESVSALLKEIGLTPSRAIAVGEHFSFASNETEEGRARNRRVEIWLE
ncbi:MAG: phosphate ABC transporter substrate-binding/OmpA family protein [Cyanobacteria bacterium P01_F01_bin.143]